jgi:hypothetical protein
MFVKNGERERAIFSGKSADYMTRSDSPGAGVV